MFPKKKEYKETSPIQMRYLTLADSITRKILSQERKEGEKFPSYTDELYKEIGILYIEPKNEIKSMIIDDVTKKLTSIWNKREPSLTSFFGMHSCVCGAHSSSTDYLLINKTGKMFMTNSLCIHYVACHRSEIPKDEWNKVLELVEGATEGETSKYDVMGVQ